MTIVLRYVCVYVSFVFNFLQTCVPGQTLTTKYHGRSLFAYHVKVAILVSVSSGTNCDCYQTKQIINYLIKINVLLGSKRTICVYLYLSYVLC